MAEKNEVAKEQEKKKDKKNLPLLSIITIGVAAITLVVSVFSLMTVMKVSAAVQTIVSGKEEEVQSADEVPLSEIEIMKFKDKFILSYPDEQDDSIHNVVVEISFGVRNNDDTADDFNTIKTTFEQKEDIVRDGMEALLNSKSYKAFEGSENISAVKADLIEYLSGIFRSKAVVDIYFNNMLTSHR